MTVSSTTLRYRDGSSDKQYTVSIDAQGDGFVVNAAWGRTGRAMQTACKTAAPVPLEEAQAAAEELLNEKRKKGYSDAEGGAAFSGIEHAGRDSGVRVQLLEPVGDGTAERMLSDPAWFMQVKYDGERRVIILEPGCPVVGTKRNGLAVAINGDLAQVCEGRIPVTGKTIIDGEDFGSTFAPFDLLMWQGDDLRDLPYSERLALLESLIETAVRVIGRNGDKRSVAMELMDGSGQWVGVGSCTIPANFSIPEAGDYVEVGYLYAYPNGGSLFQPTYKGMRRDVDDSACVTSQLKYKAEGLLGQAA